MLETKYYKDLNHNYLTIKCQGEPQDKYQLKMITENKIPGLLGCITRYINGNTYLYYEVNSRQDIKSLYEYKTLNKRQAMHILAELKNVLREIQSFLLLDSGLLLRPEYIFINCETEEVQFIYYPYEKGGNENFVLVLLEFLIKVIDHQDKQLVDIVYNLYQLADSGRFVIEEIEFLSDVNKYDDSGQKSPDFYSGTKEPSGTIMDDDSAIAVKPAYVYLESAPPSYDPPLDKKQNISLFIMAVISATGTVAVLYIKYRYLLGSQEILITWILLFTFLFILLVTGVLYLFLKFNNCTEKVVEDDISQGNGDSDGERDSERDSERNRERVNEKVADVPKRLGDTVFLYSSVNIKENKLYGMNNGIRYNINLNKLPCIVGKMAECVDHCIAEESISRVHVKFTENNNRICMTDLNSTNGTYKNGLRLEPSETVIIEAGDEIRLGNLNFNYR